MWPFGNLYALKYGLILADPPWRFMTYSAKGRIKSPDRHYATMTLDALRALPVQDLTTRDCALVMWAYWPLLPEAISLSRSWGFDYKSGGSWAKRSRTGRKWAFSTGYLMRGACEPFIIATKGHPDFVSRSERNLIVAPTREHSRKPDELHESLERLFPSVWRCELFARSARPGWDTWGDQADRFSKPPEAARNEQQRESVVL
jgi:N6-adenosine-specific RNA methylase IME4